MHQLGCVVLREGRLHLPGAQQCFGNGAELFNVVTALDRPLLHGDGEFPTEGGLVHDHQGDVTTCYEPLVLGCGAVQMEFAKASFSISRPINAEALSREITGSTAASGGLKPKANR